MRIVEEWGNWKQYQMILSVFLWLLMSQMLPVLPSLIEKSVLSSVPEELVSVSIVYLEQLWVRILSRKLRNCCQYNLKWNVIKLNCKGMHQAENSLVQEHWCYWTGSVSSKLHAFFNAWWLSTDELNHHQYWLVLNISFCCGLGNAS